MLNILREQSFSDLDIFIIEGCLNGQTYQIIASQTGYSKEYIRERAGNVFKFLSNHFGTPVKKSNLLDFTDKKPVPITPHKTDEGYTFATPASPKKPITLSLNPSASNAELVEVVNDLSQRIERLEARLAYLKETL